MTVPGIDTGALDRLERIGGSGLVRQMLELYLANGAERMRALTDAAAAGDAGGVERAAHTMKSSAGNVGAVALQRLAEQIEAAAADGSVDTTLVDRALAEFEQGTEALRRVLAERGK